MIYPLPSNFKSNIVTASCVVLSSFNEVLQLFDLNLFCAVFWHAIVWHHALLLWRCLAILCISLLAIIINSLTINADYEKSFKNFVSNYIKSALLVKFSICKINFFNEFKAKLFSCISKYGHNFDFLICKHINTKYFATKRNENLGYFRYDAEACNKCLGMIRLSAWATNLRRNITAVASRWRRCVQFDRRGNRSIDLPHR